MASLTGILVYPIKSTRAISLTTATVEHCGLAYDRRWAIVDERGGSVPANVCPSLMKVTAVPAPGGGLLLTAPGAPSLLIEPPSTSSTMQYINPVYFRNLDRVALGPPAAHAWLSDVLNQPVRLVWLDDPTRRPVYTHRGGEEGETVSLADYGPLHLMSASTLRVVDEWIAVEAAERGEPPPGRMDMVRFRPNVVIDGSPPFVEDGWKRVRIGEVQFRVIDGCFRCVVTTVDPLTLTRGDEPMRTLAKYRRRDGNVHLGSLLVPQARGRIHLGDTVTVT